MFFLAYLRNELLRRTRQAAAVALGLAVGVGLVMTVTAASSGVQKAQAEVLHALYGLGTDLTISATPPKTGKSSGGLSGDSHEILAPSQGAGVLDAGSAAKVARLPGVASAAGGLTLTDTKLGKSGGHSIPMPVSFTVDGVDLGHTGLGPYASTKIRSGRSFTASDARAYVAVVDSAYAAAHRLAPGSTLTIGGKRFRVIGTAGQSSGGSAANVYVPLAPAQRLASFQNLKSLRGHVNTIYVKAAGGAAIGTVQKEIAKVLPSATLTSSANLARAVSGNLAGAAQLANNLGRWLAVASLAAAFAVAGLLTTAAVARRVREFGTLKAIGWRSRRIVAQLMGEALVTGVVGAVLGVGLGFAGSGLVRLLAPPLSASAPGSTHSVAVHLTAPVSPAAVLLAVALAIGGALVAGSLGGWRAARLRPTSALGRVE